jgi:hypothetical protein
MESPLPLISFDGRVQDSNARFELHSEALHLLSSLENPIGTLNVSSLCLCSNISVAVISVVGLYRTGKSFLLS